MKCKTCRYFVPRTNDEGECHRHAPRKIHGIGTGEEYVMWPILHENSYCGEHSGRDSIYFCRDGIHDEAPEM